jgi:hypothetical protein
LPVLPSQPGVSGRTMQRLGPMPIYAMGLQKGGDDIGLIVGM